MSVTVSVVDVGDGDCLNIVAIALSCVHILCRYICALAMLR